MTDRRPNRWRLSTRLVHKGEHIPLDGVRATAMPVYATATFIHPSAADLDQAFDQDGWVYGRHGNPTVDGFEQAVAAIEEGVGAVAFASGMAALQAALLTAGTPRGSMQPVPGAILASRDIYGASRSLLDQLFAAQGWSVTYCDMTDLHVVAAQLRASPSVVFLEPISNPLLKVCDLPQIVELALAAGARVVVDNTIATPVLLRPLEQGADLVVHSATKYLGGHGDAIGGVVTARTHLLYDTLGRYAKLLGATLGPYEARLLLRGLKTLALRVRQQCANAQTIAKWLQDQPHVARVYYPGLPNHPQHQLATQLTCECYCGMVAFELDPPNQQKAWAFMDALTLVLPATTLGDVFSLIAYPAGSSHRDVSPEERRVQGISDGLLRLSVGIEDAEDIVADLEQALAVVK